MSWDHADCREEQPDSGTLNCCTESDLCDFANDGTCDCQDQMSWDHADCRGDAGPGATVDASVVPG
jgi:hypothetical protein